MRFEPIASRQRRRLLTRSAAVSDRMHRPGPLTNVNIGIFTTFVVILFVLGVDLLLVFTDNMEPMDGT